MALNNLADDVMSNILEMVYLDVVTLWMAGNRSLNARIARSCRIFRTDPQMSDNVLRKWPRMLASLSSLEVLSINVVEIYEEFENVIAQIKRLSPTLRELRLCFFRATQILLNDPPTFDEETGLWRDWNRQYASRSSTKKKENSGSIATDLHEPQTWKVSHHFPQLVHLTLEPSAYMSTYYQNSVSTRLSTEDAFGIFPPTLETLTWYDLIAPGPRACFTDFSLLPRNLRSFALGVHWDTVLDDEAAQSLPPNLTHLEVAGLYDASSLLSLPRTLTTGSRNGWRTSTITSELYTTLTTIPPGVRSLVGINIADLVSQIPAGTSWITLLPKSLTELSVWHYCFTSSELALLPRTLSDIIELDLDVVDLASFKKTHGLKALHKLWPPNFRYVSFHDDHRLTSTDLLGILPPTMTHIAELTATGDPDPLGSVLDALADLFPNLEWYECNTSARDADVKLSKPLPPKLKGLSLSIKSFATSKLSKLPRGLENLILDGIEITKSKHVRRLARMPPTLRELTLTKLDRSALGNLPPSLTRLTCDSFKGENPKGWRRPSHLRITGKVEPF